MCVASPGGKRSRRAAELSLRRAAERWARDLRRARERAEARGLLRGGFRALAAAAAAAREAAARRAANRDRRAAAAAARFAAAACGAAAAAFDAWRFAMREGALSA